jgi:hypothetical protein
MLWTRTTKLIVAPIYLILISNGLINSLYFYLDAGAQRCFIEDLPLDTIVNGMDVRIIFVLAFFY